MDNAGIGNGVASASAFPSTTWERGYSVHYILKCCNPNLQREEIRITDDAVRRRFFFDALPLLDKVLSFGDRQDTGFLLAPTAHYFMQLLNGVLRFDPSLVLDRATKVVKFSTRFNYNLDALALREMVKL